MFIGYMLYRMFIPGCNTCKDFYKQIFKNKTVAFFSNLLLSLSAWANKRLASFQFLNLKRRNAMRKWYRLRIASFGVAWALHTHTHK